MKSPWLQKWRWGRGGWFGHGYSEHCSSSTFLTISSITSVGTDLPYCPMLFAQIECNQLQTATVGLSSFVFTLRRSRCHGELYALGR